MVILHVHVTNCIKYHAQHVDNINKIGTVQLDTLGHDNKSLEYINYLPLLFLTRTTADTYCDQHLP